MLIVQVTPSRFSEMQFFWTKAWYRYNRGICLVWQKVLFRMGGHWDNS